MLPGNVVTKRGESKMSDFEDEEGVDEPVLDDENEDEGQEEEEVSVSKNLSYQYSCLLHIEQFETTRKIGFLRPCFGALFNFD